MSVGIYTHYAHCDQAYLAVRLVEWLRGLGEPFDIYSDTTPGKLGLPYDQIVKHRSVIRYTDWAQKQRVIIWTHVPRIEQVEYAQRKKILTILAPMWQDLVAPFRKTMKRADHVVALGQNARELYTDIYKISDVKLTPYEPGLPLTKKEAPVNPRQIKLFLPWFDRNARCASSAFLGHLAFLLERMEEAHLTVAINSSRFGPAVAKFFTRLGVRTGGRVLLLRAVPWSRRPALYSSADLTVWPGECDNYGQVGLTSLTAGTPLLTLATPPHTEYLYQGANAALVKTKLDYDENGVPHATPDYALYAAALQELVTEPWHINNMQKKVSTNILARRIAFEGGWRKLLQL